MILIRLTELLEEQEKSIYWLAQNAGIPYASLWKLAQKDTQSSISLPMLFRICAALDCEITDILVYEDDEESEAIKALIKRKEKKKGR
jgi:putative transcriptional regulator